MPSICSIEGCDNPDYIKKWCIKHYTRWRRHGDPMARVRELNRHGMYGSPEYAAWVDMKGRVLNPKHKSFPSYGGRGIKICNRWLENFQNFYDDMGPRPSKHSLDRRDNNGDYAPENCRWTTATVQVINRRLPKSNSTGYRGICIHRATNTWRARVKIEKKEFTIGYYHNIEEAALAYDIGAIFFYGDDAITNIL